MPSAPASPGRPSEGASVSWGIAPARRIATSSDAGCRAAVGTTSNCDISPWSSWSSMWQWITYLPLKSLKWPATRIVSPGSTKKVSLRQRSQACGGAPLRSSMYQSVWCMCMTWATAVRLRDLPGLGRAQHGMGVERAGLKVWPLISQVGTKIPPTEITQVRSGARRASLTQPGSGRSLPGTPVRSRPSLADPELHQRRRRRGGRRPRPRRPRGAAAQLDRAARGRGEVDDHLRRARRGRAGRACASPASASARCRRRSGSASPRWRGRRCRSGSWRR